MHHCFSLNLTVVPNAWAHGVCTCTVHVPGALMPSYWPCWPQTGKCSDYSPRNSMFISAAYCSYLTDTQISDQKYKLDSFFPINSPAVYHSLLYSPSAASNTWFKCLSHARDPLTISLFKGTPVCLCSASATKLTQLLQLIIAKEGKSKD